MWKSNLLSNKQLNESCNTPWFATCSKDCTYAESHHSLLFQCIYTAYITADKNVQVSHASFSHICVEMLYLKGSCCVDLNITISYVSSNLILCTWKTNTPCKRKTTKDSLSSFRSRLVSPLRSASPLSEITRTKWEKPFSLPCDYLKSSRLNFFICNNVSNRSSELQCGLTFSSIAGISFFNHLDLLTTRYFLSCK